MSVDLIVVTEGRREDLQRLFCSLVKQEYRNFRAIVIDQNPPGFLNSLIGEYSKNIPIVHKRIESCGASAARNFGLRELSDRTTLIAFPDDDCWYEPDTLQKVVEFFDAHPDCGAVVGKWKDCRREAVDKYKVFYQAGTCFYFLRKIWADRIGGFDESLGPGPHSSCVGGEDTDYLLRGMERGMTVFREPDIRIHHPDMPAGQTALGKVRGYGRARMVLLKRHHYPFWFRLANLAYPICKMAMHPLSWRYWWCMFTGRLRGW